MIDLALHEIAAITGGHLVGDDVTVTGSVVTDSRQAQPGGLYVARVGEHADGHQYAPSAQAAGAVATLGSRPIEGMPTVVVDDVQAAFAALARAVVDRVPGLTIVGITGSSGKTSTKDLMGQVLGAVAPTVSPEGSYNSEVGVPLTVCRVEQSTRFLVAEMGADGVGHIAYLTQIAPPQVGIVLNVGQAHLGSFGSVEAIAETKGALIQALPADGLAVLNADDPRVLAMSARASCPVVTVGCSPAADIRATDVELDPLGRSSYNLQLEGETYRVRLGLFGAHQVGNSLSVLAAARHLGVPMETILQVFAQAHAISRWRMEVHELPTGVTIVNDAYNANPDSMHAALRTLAHLGKTHHPIAVLGEMRELGEHSGAEHEAVGAFAVEQGITDLVVVGEGARGIADSARRAGAKVTFIDDVDAAYDHLTATMTRGDVILLKSSRDSGLRYLGDRITRDAGVEVGP